LANPATPSITPPDVHAVFEAGEHLPEDWLHSTVKQDHPVMPNHQQHEEPFRGFAVVHVDAGDSSVFAKSVPLDSDGPVALAVKPEADAS